MSGKDNAMSLSEAQGFFIVTSFRYDKNLKYCRCKTCYGEILPESDAARVRSALQKGQNEGRTAATDAGLIIYRRLDILRHLKTTCTAQPRAVKEGAAAALSTKS
jgi:hypothetical protein